MSEPRRIVVAGAGAIGCYVGGVLAEAGHDVVLLGRERIASDIAKNGLRVSHFDGWSHGPVPVTFSTDPVGLAGADLVLVAVKSAATRDMARSIARHAPGATVLSLQNGISNADELRVELPRASVLATVVSFNVVETGPGAFHQATSGGILLEDDGSGLAGRLAGPHLGWEAAGDVRAAQWGKLLVNLNNALNALSGLTLLEQLQDRAWRRLLADQMAETLATLKAAGVTPAKFTAVSPGMVPHILRLPTPLFRRIAKAMLTIDPAARSSMQDDLRLGRKTEVDALQGAVLALAARVGTDCPVIARVAEAVRAAEAAQAGPPGLDPALLRD